jgi:hypothetical protein
MNRKGCGGGHGLFEVLSQHIPQRTEGGNQPDQIQIGKPPKYRSKTLLLASTSSVELLHGKMKSR